MQPPQTQYVERGGVAIAYQVMGDGAVDLLVSPGFVSHLDLGGLDPKISMVWTRLASFARLITYDKPGTGLSDPIGHLPTLEERVADLEAVLDAAGSERAVLFGASEGGPTSVLMAAMRPQRIISLILYGTFAVWPTGAPEDFSSETIERAELRELFEAVEHWGDADSLMKVFAPSVTMSEAQKRAFGMFARAAASPRMARALIETWVQIDIRDVLPSVGVPTLVLHADGDRVVPVEAGERLPAGLSISSNGQITGTPMSAGVSNVVLPVRDSFGVGASSATIPLTIPAHPAPAVLPSAATRAQIQAGLLAQLSVKGKLAKFAALKKQKSYSYFFKALSAGVLVVNWYYLPPGAHLSKKTKAKPVLFASGRLSFSAPGTKKLTIKLTGKGLKLLRHRKSIKLAARGSFTPPHQNSIVATTSIKLKR